MPSQLLCMPVNAVEASHPAGYTGLGSPTQPAFWGTHRRRQAPAPSASLRIQNRYRQGPDGKRTASMRTSFGSRSPRLTPLCASHKATRVSPSSRSSTPSGVSTAVHPSTEPIVGRLGLSRSWRSGAWRRRERRRGRCHPGCGSGLVTERIHASGVRAGFAPRAPRSATPTARRQCHAARAGRGTTGVHRSGPRDDRG